MDPAAKPKVELHRHLEGSIRLSTIIELSRAAGVPLPAHTPEGLAPHALITSPVAGLEQALKGFRFAQDSLQSYEAVRRVAREAVEDLATDGVRLAELRFSPDFMCRPAGLDWGGALEAILGGLEDARQAGSEVAVGLVAIFSRDFGLRSGEETVAFALKHRDDLVGFDIAGTELGYPPSMYTDLVAPLQGSGLGLTVHYGEAGPPDFPRAAVEVLGADRLGHGLSVARDPATATVVADRGVTLEMCPTSNWLTAGVPRLGDHPIRRLLLDGISVTLNTDDPGLMGIDLVHEWRVAREEIGFTDDDFRAVTTNALVASFLPDDVKERVRKEHFGWLDEED